MRKLNLHNIHPSWTDVFTKALSQVPKPYLLSLSEQSNWLPGPKKIFNAFSLPLTNTRYILLGESPYPRRESANGFAFWDEAVTSLWSPMGLSKEVNRATSLRNLIKMLLISSGYLANKSVTQADIVSVDKTGLVSTLPQLFSHLQNHGFLLLNASLVFSDRLSVNKDARMWQPFIVELLTQIYQQNQNVRLVLFGKIAQKIASVCPLFYNRSFVAEHPYNLSFIHNLEVQRFFQPFHLLNG